LKYYKDAVCRRVSSVWHRRIGAFLIVLLLAGCSLEPPTPEVFNPPTLTPTPTIDPHDYTPTPVIYPTSSDSSPAPRRDCTFPSEYWKDHPQDWQFAVITVGGQTYNKQQALVFFNTKPVDTYIFIYEQIFTITNNILSGADPQVIKQVVDQMNSWLDQHPLGSALSNADQVTGVHLARQIESYNLGFTGPGLCAGIQAVATADFAYVLVEVTSTPTATETPQPKAPASGNSVHPPWSPTPTPKPTRKPGGGGGGPAPTQPPANPTSAPPTSTKAPPPPPTKTKAPTKLPTPTSPPLPTSVPTKPPNPTPGGGLPMSVAAH
jgi:hypothetical protein